MKKLPVFKDKKLFEQAFVHRSFLNETREKLSSNERLEFLGDSILSFVVSTYLFEKHPDFNEGTLTNLRALLVNTKSLGETAAALGFGKLLKLSKGEEESKGRINQSLLADAFEAFIGALYLDQGIAAASAFIHEALLPKSDVLARKKSLKDPKSLLQEKVQAQKQSSPVYKVLNEVGPAHAKIFTVGVFVNDSQVAEGTGTSKQKAEENAAMQALEM